MRGISVSYLHSQHPKKHFHSQNINFRHIGENAGGQGHEIVIVEVPGVARIVEAQRNDEERQEVTNAAANT